ncbi:MAG TPA: tripartite tricarboxylate transporter substrate binding protein [Burkholderiales bacterium]|nr:tripartite tricarboxylate transporter substrate binding protein [Burkholderiales bacterium]
MNSEPGSQLFAGLFAALLIPYASAQEYPGRPVHIIVPSTPGGGYDVIGRLLAERLSPQLGQPFVVENRAGGGTLVGTQAVAAAAPDGYALLVGGLANMAFNPGLHKDVRYDPVRDFAPVAMVGAFTYALIGRKDLAPANLQELIGTGYLDLLVGRVDLFFDNTTTARPFIADARVKPYCTSGSASDALLADVPTAAEAGLRQLVLDSWIGLFAPAKRRRPRSSGARRRSGPRSCTRQASGPNERSAPAGRPGVR